MTLHRLLAHGAIALVIGAIGVCGGIPARSVASDGNTSIEAGRNIEFKMIAPSSQERAQFTNEFRDLIDEARADRLHPHVQLVAEGGSRTSDATSAPTIGTIRLDLGDGSWIRVTGYLNGSATAMGWITPPTAHNFASISSATGIISTLLPAPFAKVVGVVAGLAVAANTYCKGSGGDPYGFIYAKPAFGAGGAPFCQSMPPK